ncbi:MAG: hypothetical protein CVV64_04070 [Candidatus Wallbacteria bacterium HGW-Wallbacteria-1]|jgi:(p)ppGpp synthase/HD superfamily hydrolase|uniref:RelA/SpoT domain-containing protein n=1 Tax=Candidatus Wallbacteria bacterium HGW-Wallbacteria-1 TaxID=2013854 RepID=A0A2N1PRJ6_9BACT|nr:MAG: hypothetical protein CVV64_04070 [Candidatus Wallbacteria bacterium HGW-Wallbacteria-1]
MPPVLHSPYTGIFGLNSLIRDFETEFILSRLQDRLELLKTIIHAPRLIQRFIATETTNLFVPLAHRYGYWHMKNALEDACFRILDPQAYNQIMKKLSTHGPSLEKTLKNMIATLNILMKERGIHSRIIGRIKSVPSIYRKIKKSAEPFEKIMDIFAARIITDSVDDCYAALGAIREKWQMLPEKFRDYILTPKMNGYQSIHAKIKLRSHIIEIQIRTARMHDFAEQGRASHFYYKEVMDCEDESSSDWKLSVIRKMRIKRPGALQQIRNQTLHLKREKVIHSNSMHIAVMPGGIKSRGSVFKITRRLLRSRSEKNIFPGISESGNFRTDESESKNSPTPELS